MNTSKLNLYEQVARIGKALASPIRLGLLDLLSQGQKTVEVLSKESGIEVKLVSSHLRVLKEARLVDFQREGKYVCYSIAGEDISVILVHLRQVANAHLVELNLALGNIISEPNMLCALDKSTFLDKARNGDIFVIDVRPIDEYEEAHLPFAKSMPLAELEKRMLEIPIDVDVVAYCRGPFCLLSDEAVKLLTAKGYKIQKMSDGVNEWKAAGLPLEY
jgi:rhodanese-related sulfurtransferase